MPLSAPAERELIHSRRIECRGYRRRDGLWDIEGRLVDTKSYAFTNAWRGEVRPGEPVHDMSIRLTIDDDFVVRDVQAVTDASPFRICPDITPRFAALKGLKIGKGWRRAIAERLGGVHGCTHLVELLGPLGTTAYQTILPLRDAKGRGNPVRTRPAAIDTCHALRSDGEVVRQHWPEFYTGDDTRR
ncbi:MAG TPA: DUF2889 domain-containing protein [Alphaproteobacteria bacterium]